MAQILNPNALERGYIKPGTNNEIGYFEERLSKRREKEKEEKKINEFLRTSIRESERLKALEKANRVNYKINIGYIDEGLDGNFLIDVAGLTDTLCNRKHLKNILPPSELKWLKQYVRGDIFQSSYSTCNNLSEILNKYDCLSLHGSTNACSYLDSVSDHINSTHSRTKKSQYKFQMRELLQILSRIELRTLCYANDGCARINEISEKYRKNNELSETMLCDTNVDVLTRSKNNDSCINTTKEYSSIPSDIQETVRIIQSPLKGCYAELHPSERGIPLKTVVLEKGSQPLGATVRNEREAVVVGRIVVGGVAQKSGLLKEGDELLSVNGIELTGRDVNEVSDILSRMSGTLKFTVASVDDSANLSAIQNLQTTMIHLRALYNYNPDDDVYIPCKDIGLGFARGDILNVTNVQDPNWWQAYKDFHGTENGTQEELAGLIPSPDYQYQREILRKQLGGDNECLDIYANEPSESSIFCLKKSKKNTSTLENGGWVYNVDVSIKMANTDSTVIERKRKLNKKSNKTTYCPGDMELSHPDSNINTYEEVEIFLPQPHRKRPVVFVGPDEIGINELVEMILIKDSDQFCRVKQHTTLETKSTNYLQVTKEEFIHLQNQEEFIETGIFRKNWYGTSKTELKSVMDSGKTAILVLQPESLHKIRKANFIPYVICVNPSSKIDVLRNLRQRLEKERPSDEELFAILNRVKMMDFKFGHMFDTVLVIEILEKALDTVLNIINRLDRDPQWVPSCWLSHRPISKMP